MKLCNLFAVQGGTHEDSQNMLKLIRAVENSIYARQKKIGPKTFIFLNFFYFTVLQSNSNVFFNKIYFMTKCHKIEDVTI